MQEREYIEQIARIVSKIAGENPDELAFKGEPYVLATGAKVIKQSQMAPCWTFYTDIVYRVLEAQRELTSSG